MLSWICPDCGCDCAPTDQECPDCADLVQAGMVALARAVEEHRKSFPREPEVPVRDLLPMPELSIVPRSAAPAPPRIVELLPAIEAPSVVLPVASEVPDNPVPLFVPLPEAEPEPRRFSVPGWLISLLVATGLSLGGAAVIRNMEKDHKAEAASPQASLPSDSNIEVTALRVLGGPRFGSQLQYVVVNHSATALAKTKLRIDVHSLNLQSSAHPLFTINVQVTGLGPFASREMTAPIEDVQAGELPDWGHMKAQVQVVGQ